jgi:SAM-dependent MidA family methyltransferase
MLSIAQNNSPLVEHLRNIINSQGPLSFAQYMQQALYAPGLGYYSAGSQKFGAKGDFITAPEISPLFANCVAVQIAQVFEKLSQTNILEFGAGTGVLAADILQALEKSNQLPESYYIVELSADLQQRQRALLQERVPHLLDKVIWLSTLDNIKLSGVIIANEVLDAMPVHKFKWEQQQLKEFFVDWQHDKFVWLLDAPCAELQNYIHQLNIHFDDEYESEANLLLKAWLASVAEILTQGAILLIDYGFPREEYYHPQRHMGTLMCHYQHRAHDDPLILTGSQDITAHVDFTAVAQAAVESNLKVCGFTTQANFLLNCGITDMIDPNTTAEQQWQMSQQIKKLLLPSEMGELFKVMALTKHFDHPLIGLSRG